MRLLNALASVALSVAGSYPSPRFPAADTISGHPARRWFTDP
jgi:hypothetical protein